MQLNPFNENFLTTKSNRDIWRIRRFQKRFGDKCMVLSMHGGQGGECARLCQKHGTDKGGTDASTHAVRRDTPLHSYAQFYELIFAQKRQHIGHVLECGIGTMNVGVPSYMISEGDYQPGASLRMWQEYFPRAQIVGIDIDSDILFQEERIETYQCDQTDPQSICAFLAELDDRKFDIVIDDGLHETHAAATLFENCIDQLADDGVYVIEDVKIGDMPHYASYFSSDYLVRFVFPVPISRLRGLVVVSRNSQ